MLLCRAFGQSSPFWRRAMLPCSFYGHSFPFWRLARLWPPPPLKHPCALEHACALEHPSALGPAAARLPAGSSPASDSSRRPRNRCAADVRCTQRLLLLHPLRLALRARELFLLSPHPPHCAGDQRPQEWEGGHPSPASPATPTTPTCRSSRPPPPPPRTSCSRTADIQGSKSGFKWHLKGTDLSCLEQIVVLHRDPVDYHDPSARRRASCRRRSAPL